MKKFNFTINPITTELTIKSNNKYIFSVKFLTPEDMDIQAFLKFDEKLYFGDNYIRFDKNNLIIGINDTCMMETKYKLNFCEVMGLKYQIKNAYKKK